MVCFLGHCEVIVLEGRQGLVTPQLVILQCSLILEKSVFQKCGSATMGPICKYFLLSPSFNWEEFLKEKIKAFTFYFSCAFCTHMSLFHLLQTLLSLSWEH